MTADGPNAQIQADLESAVAAALAARRPILHHLNADTSWLLQLPLPNRDDDRPYFNILIDPWLFGGQSDVASWFSQQFHATESAVPSIAAAETLLRHVERITVGREPTRTDSPIDAVAISHEFTDHCHKDTLLQIPSSVPVYATKQAAKLIASWGHFDAVHTTPSFVSDRTTIRNPGLPSRISISRLTAPGDTLDYHSALLFSFGKECVIYTPHGILPSAVKVVTAASPPLKTLALIHGLHDVRLASQQLNLGGPNGLEAQQVLGARYWIGTHDEVKRGRGLVSWFLGRRAWTAEEVLGDSALKGAEWVELSNGESKVLI